MLSQILKNRTFTGLLIGVFISITLTISLYFSVFQNINSTLTNSLYTRNEPLEEIIIIGIDDKSTQNQPVGLGRFSQWSRENFSKLLKILENEKPKVIAFDLLFHTYTDTIPRNKLVELNSALVNIETEEQKLEYYQKFFEDYFNTFSNPIDHELAQQFQKQPNLVLAGGISDDFSEVIEPLFKFSANSAIGLTKVFPDETGILKTTIPYYNIKGEQYDSFGVTVAKKYLQKDHIEIPTQKNPQTNQNEMLVNFFGAPLSYTEISFIDVLNKNFQPEYFDNKIILIGVTASRVEGEEFLTPRSNITPMSGVEFRANEIQTILQQKFLTKQTTNETIIITALLAILISILLSYLGIQLSIILTILVSALYTIFAHLLYRYGIIINMVYPYLAVIFAFTLSWAYKFFIADKNKRQIKKAFSHYVSDKLVNIISKNPETVKLGGERKEVTVFFSDIKGSTTYSEKTSIESWVSMMNEYFDVMEQIIYKYDGTIDKYEGDAIMCFWNAPVSQENHQELALKAALEMKKALKSLHQKWEKEGKPLIEFRIGINTGQVIVGNFGSKNRFDYTVMGDTVNTASRLESSANKSYGTKIITKDIQKTDPKISDKFIFRELDTVYLPGKKQAVTLFEVISIKEEFSSKTKNTIENYQKGLQAYRQKDFKTAREYLEKNINEKSASAEKLYRSDKPSEIMLGRIEKLEKNEIVVGLQDDMTFRILNK